VCHRCRFVRMMGKSCPKEFSSQVLETDADDIAEIMSALGHSVYLRTWVERLCK
jgi:hypothetical protein